MGFVVCWIGFVDYMVLCVICWYCVGVGGWVDYYLIVDIM